MFLCYFCRSAAVSGQCRTRVDFARLHCAAHTYNMATTIMNTDTYLTMMSLSSYLLNFYRIRVQDSMNICMLITHSRCCCSICINHFISCVERTDAWMSIKQPSVHDEHRQDAVVVARYPPTTRPDDNYRSAAVSATVNFSSSVSAVSLTAGLNKLQHSVGHGSSNSVSLTSQIIAE